MTKEQIEALGWTYISGQFHWHPDQHWGGMAPPDLWQIQHGGDYWWLKIAYPNGRWIRTISNGFCRIECLDENRYSPELYADRLKQNKGRCIYDGHCESLSDLATIMTLLQIPMITK